MKNRIAFESKLATMFDYGTWFSTAVIAVGLGISSELAIKLGIALFISMPVVRLISMCVAFFKDGNKKLAYTTLLVIMIIMLSLVVGVVTSKMAD